MPDGREHPIVLFDGVCHLCNSTVQFLIRHDPDKTLRFGALQEQHAVLEPFDIDTRTIDTVVLIDDGDLYTRSRAVLRSLTYLESPWPMLGRILGRIPRPISDLVYRCVAKTRYTIFGKRNTCMIPEPDVQNRFLSESSTDR